MPTQDPDRNEMTDSIHRSKHSLDKRQMGFSWMARTSGCTRLAESNAICQGFLYIRQMS